MKKWLVVLLALTMVMSMALTGCGGGDAEGGFKRLRQGRDSW